jgi:hypothetical protein
MPLVNMQPVSMQPVSMQPIRMQPASMQPISMRPVSIQPQVRVYPVSKWTGASCFVQSTVAMLAGGNRNANNVPSGHDGMRDWSYGLCDGSARCGLCA